MKPKWATPERQAYLARLIQESGGLCVHGDGLACRNPDHLALVFIDDLVKSWVADDLSQRRQLEREESNLLHRCGDEHGRWGRQFDPTAKLVYGAKQPDYFDEGHGVSRELTRVEKVRVPSTPVRLYVQIPPQTPAKLRAKMSRNAKRKWKRYGKVPRTVDSLCAEAVKDFWATRP